MATITDCINQLPDAFISGVNCSVQLQISAPMYVVIKNNTCSVFSGYTNNPDVSLRGNDQTLVQLLKGELNGMTAYMTGKLQVDGDLVLAKQLSHFFDASKIS